MTRIPTIIFAGEKSWQVSHENSMHDIASSAGLTPAQIATEIAAIIGSTPRDVTLALPASWCLSATVSLNGVPIRNRRTALLYRLELLLPLTAEEIAADYIFDDSTTAFAVCVPVATVKPFIDAIEAQGSLIHSVIPASLFAASSLLASQRTLELVVWQSAQSIELFTAKSGTVTGWFTFPANADDLHWHLDQLSEKGRLHNVIACHVEPDLLAALQAKASLQLALVDNRLVEQVVCSAMAAGEHSPVNLRQGRLSPSSALRAIRRPLNEAMLSAVLMIVCVCSALCWRAARFEQAASSNREQQEKLFLQTFPGRSVPINIVSRLKSEDRALGIGSANGTKPISHLTLTLLHSILEAIAGLPPQTRLQVDDLKVTDGKFALDGFVKNRNDLTNVVEAMQQSSSIKLDPPQTEQAVGKGLHIILNGIAADNAQLK